MADTVGALPPTTGLPVLSGVALPTQAVIELAQTPPAAVLLASTLTGVVIGRNVDGALLLNTDLGTLALKTLLAIAPGTPVDLRLVPGPPPSVILLPREEPGQSAAPRSDGGAADAPGSKSGALRALASLSAAEEPPTQLAIGTEVDAILLAPATGGPADLAAGTHLVLRVAIIPPPSPPVAPAGSSPTTFTGLVVAGAADQAGRTTVETPIGTLLLDRALAVAPGTVLSIERVATLVPKPTAGGEFGTVLGATVVAPAQGGTPPALAAGTRLTLRVTPTPPSSGTVLPATSAADDVFVGTVVANAPSETMVETPIGMLALERRLALPPGTLLGLQRLAVTPPDAPVDEPVAQRSSWPALQDALGALDRAAPSIAARLRADLMPKSGPELAGTLLFLLGALGSGTWPGAKAGAALDLAGQHALRMRLEGDVTEMRGLADPPKGEWRVFVLPWLDGSIVRPIRLYLRRRARGENRPEEGTRFLLDVDLSRLGEVQFDGLVRKQRFDLVMRSHRPIGVEMRRDIAEVFRDATSAAGLAGDVVFTTASRFAVTPLDALRQHIGVEV